MNQGDRSEASQSASSAASGAPWQFRLYVNGRTALKTVLTLQNLKDLCDEHLEGRYELEVIDLLEDFDRAREDRILALPTLVRRSPPPIRKVIGDLSNRDQVVAALGLGLLGDRRGD
jgi:circadian clock protein KaiB